MANDNLKNALSQAGLTPEEFAAIIRVDPKSVQRWVAGVTRPYPRHRARVARALDRTEHELWPEDIAEAAASDGDGTESFALTSEVVGTWGTINDPGAPTTADLFAEPLTSIDVLEGASGLLQSPGLIEHLRRHAAAGCHVRLLLSAPTADVLTLHGQTGLELRIADTSSLAHVLIRADDTMLLGLWLIGTGSPVLTLTRRTDNGLFGQLAQHFTKLWQHAEPPADTAQAATQRPGVEKEPGTDGTAASGSPDPAGRASPRRWPRRAD